MKSIRAIALVALILIPAVLVADGARYRPGDVTTITDCAADGSSSSASIAAGRYVVCAFSEDVYVCEAATCAAAGQRIAPGQCYDWIVGGTAAVTFSCRSASAAGDLQWAPKKTG